MTWILLIGIECRIHVKTWEPCPSSHQPSSCRHTDGYKLVTLVNRLNETHETLKYISANFDNAWDISIPYEGITGTPAPLGTFLQVTYVQLQNITAHLRVVERLNRNHTLHFPANDLDERLMRTLRHLWCMIQQGALTCSGSRAPSCNFIMQGHVLSSHTDARTFANNFVTLAKNMIRLSIENLVAII